MKITKIIMLAAISLMASMPAAAISKRTMDKALAGDAEAQYRVGTDCFDSGDSEGAINWLSQACNQGHVESMYFLGYVYYAIGDDANSVSWFEKAADNGHGGAMFNLANCYFNGQGVPSNNSKGVEWLRKASQVNEPSAINFLGQLYHNGMAVEKDYYQAYLLFKKSAGLGDPEAMRRLGIYLNDLYHPKKKDMPDPRIQGILDPELGREMFKQSADAGNSMAQLYFVQHYLLNEKKDEYGDAIVDEELIKYMLMVLNNEEMTDEDSRRVICAKLADYYEAELGGLTYDENIVADLRARAGEVKDFDTKKLNRKLTSLDLNNDMTITTHINNSDGTVTKLTTHADGSENASNYNPADGSINWTSETTPDLTCIKKFADGSIHKTEVNVIENHALEYITKNGETLISRRVEYTDGSSIVENADGSKEETSVTINPDNSITYTTVITMPDGTTKTRTSQSSKESV